MICALLFFQLAATAPQPTFTVSGVVSDAATGRPLDKYNVATYSGGKQMNTVTDEQGRYRLSGLPAGDYQLDARNSQGSGGFAGTVSRRITIAGQDLEHIDFKMRTAGTVTGKVTDENREPVVGANVYLVSREYFSGMLGYFFKDVTRTDDRGVYSLKRVEAGHAYLVMVDNAEGKLEAHSDAPLDPKLRRRAILRTFYPNSPDRQGASVITVGPGETREGVDIEARKAPTYCVEGTLLSLGGPAPLNFMYEAAQPSYGTSTNSGMFAAGRWGVAGPDGKYRICGLVPGSYRAGAFDTYAPEKANRALVSFDITDRDIRNLDLTISPGLTVKGEVVWDGEEPAQPVETRIGVSLTPMLRSPIANERPYARVGLPGTFAISGLLPTDYNVHVNIVNDPSLYIKDISYAGKSVQYEPLRVGSTAGDMGLRVTIGRDGGKLSARVADKEGNPLADMRVIVLPASISSEAMLEAAIVSGQTNQAGQYQTRALRPGKYLVLATDDRIDSTPECIDSLWRSRTRFQEVELAPNGTAQVTLSPVSFRR